MLFNGEEIFGEQCTQLGPTRGYRTQIERIPGVDGERVYRLGAGPRRWRVGGRLAADDAAALARLLEAGSNYEDGLHYVFTCNAGLTYENCRLVGYGPVGQVLTCQDGTVTVRVAAEVVQSAP